MGLSSARHHTKLPLNVHWIVPPLLLIVPLAMRYRDARGVNRLQAIHSAA